jgi:hypothetical protein
MNNIDKITDFIKSANIFVNGDNHSQKTFLELKNNLMELKFPKSMTDNKNNLMNSLERNTISLVKNGSF